MTQVKHCKLPNGAPQRGYETICQQRSCGQKLEGEKRMPEAVKIISVGRGRVLAVGHSGLFSSIWQDCSKYPNLTTPYRSKLKPTFTSLAIRYVYLSSQRPFCSFCWVTVNGCYSADRTRLILSSRSTGPLISKHSFFGPETGIDTPRFVSSL